jgi:hypothetical protein
LLEGPVTAELLRNLEEFQEAWAMWRSAYRRVQITADQVLPPQQMSARCGVFALSGGVDGTFALLRHHSGRAGLRTAPPVCAMLVQGFDIPLDNQAAFERAHGSISDVMRALGVPLVTVRTNWREQLCKDWLMEYHAALTACLFQFRGLANVGVCGAGEDYSQLVVPWGSNPVTNHLLSGGGFQVHTEGAGFTRTERVRLICDYPEIAAKLRVCWEGPKTGGNCGRCEKCIRTKLNFLANRQEPLCFDGRPTRAQILGLTARNQEKYEKDDIVVGVNWNGSTLRARLKNPTIVYGYPRDGYPVWMDNLAVLKDAKNVENAKLFQNFIMDPENAAMISAFAKYANGIKGSEAFMPDELKNAPEIVVPKEFESAGEFALTCPPEANDLYTRIWTDLQK